MLLTEPLKLPKSGTVTDGSKLALCHSLSPYPALPLHRAGILLLNGCQLCQFPLQLTRVMQNSVNARINTARLLFCSNADLGHLSDCNPACLIPLRIHIFSFQAVFHRSTSSNISISMCSQGPGCLRLEALIGEGGTSTAADQERGFRHLMLSPGMGRNGYGNPPRQQRQQFLNRNLNRVALLNDF